MPYNTRRKSLSLPSLGIQLPQSSRQHQSPPASAKGEQPPQKKVKRDHSPLINVANQSTTRYEPTPPLSPPPERNINHEEIGDEIVSGVVNILETTGNRPHTVKELAAVLAPTINIVENSANPHAIISSRLNGYLKRGFNRSSPCILKKELITTHPRRIYFYLSTCPHQPIPQHENDVVPARRSVVSPALSDEEEEENRKRSEMSPSPEVDLSSHELDDDNDNDISDTASSLSSTTSTMIARGRTRSPSTLDPKNTLSSPPLEGDEREFSQSAIYLDRRSLSREKDVKTEEPSPKRSRQEYEAEENEDAAGTLLGYPTVTVTAFSSPSLGPTTEIKREDNAELERPLDKPHPVAENAELYSWSGEFERHLGSPESVELDELDDLLDF
ncbi:hypothetical protein EDC01DRAFT_617145 [Geopyxis carbonaria]|nr:hypothetical protein EDC01DRAFT_617145 [Geopyxis carbonaria]